MSRPWWLEAVWLSVQPNVNVVGGGTSLSQKEIPFRSILSV